jgi:ArsR family transcriptional regulator
MAKNCGPICCRDRAKCLKAMAHPARLAMLEKLLGGERCVCELQELVRSDITTVSKHLSLMRQAGLVVSRRSGLKIFYRLKDPRLAEMLGFVGTIFGGASRRKAEASR